MGNAPSGDQQQLEVSGRSSASFSTERGAPQRDVLLRAVGRAPRLTAARMVAGNGATTFLAMALVASSLPLAICEARGFARLFSAPTDVPSRLPEDDAPREQRSSLLSSLWIPFRLPWSRDRRPPKSKSPIDPISAILNNNESMSLNDTQIVAVENGGEAFRIVDTDVSEHQQNSTEIPTSRTSNYTIPEEESAEDVEEVEVTDIPTTTAEPYRPHKRPVIKSAGSTVVRNCRTTVQELEERLRRSGKFNPLFMASTIEEAGLNFRSLLPPRHYGGVGGSSSFAQQQSVLFSHDAADEDEECDALCREFRDAATRALKESEAAPSPTLADLPKTSPQMDAPPVLADGVAQSVPFSAKCTFRGNVKINSTCTKRGSSTEGDDNLSELCDKCIVIQSVGPGCFPSLFNTISCVGDGHCLFDDYNDYYGKCTESYMYLPVFRNVPTPDGCDNWVQESIPVPIACSCALLRDRYNSPLHAEF